MTGPIAMEVGWSKKSIDQVRGQRGSGMSYQFVDDGYIYLIVGRASRDGEDIHLYVTDELHKPLECIMGFNTFWDKERFVTRELVNTYKDWIKRGLDRGAEDQKIFK